MIKKYNQGGRVIVEADYEPNKDLAKALGMLHLMEPARPFTENSAKKYLHSHYKPTHEMGHCYYAPSGTRFVSPKLIHKTLIESLKDGSDVFRKKLDTLLQYLDKNNLNIAGRREAEFLVISNGGEQNRSERIHDYLYQLLNEVSERAKEEPFNHNKILTAYNNFKDIYLRFNSSKYKETKSPEAAIKPSSIVDDLEEYTAICFAEILRGDHAQKNRPSVTTRKKVLTLGRFDFTDPDNIIFLEDTIRDNFE